jgi:N-glycosylase/DNA lyase
MIGFSLQNTLLSGQVFRWRLEEKGAWVAHADKVFFVANDGSTRGVDETWADEFLRRDQPLTSHDHPYVKQAIAATKGVRVLRQDPWECLITFIVSQNNHQKRIQKNCFAITEAFGKPLEQGFHAFPAPQELGSEEQLRALGLGYRAKWIAALKNIDLGWLYSLRALPYQTAKKELCTINGVGPKVADCILLFSLGFDEACPEDVWIKRVFQAQGLTRETLGPKAGLLQQHIFHYARLSGSRKL